MKRVVFNQKGGVGKTSIACNIAAAMASLCQKTLVVDLDAQGNSSQYLLGDAFAGIERTVADFFASTLSFKLFKDSLKDTIVPTSYDNLYVIPADLGLVELQPKLEGRYKIFKLAEALDALVDRLGFDQVVIDTPPALNFYSMSALLAADRVLIPFDCDAFSAAAVAQVAEAVAEVRDDHRPELQIEGIVVNQYSKTARQSQEVLSEIVTSEIPVLRPYLTSSVVMKESHSAATPLVFYKNKHALTKLFIELTQNLIAERQRPRRPRRRPAAAGQQP